MAACPLAPPGTVSAAADVLAGNAGLCVIAPFAETALEQWDRLFGHPPEP
jgi:NAD(P)-dependent dehydrogenase (short-subunit alcohol dehydrogenase family)